MDLEQYYDDIYRYCYLRLNNRHAAEDMAQALKQLDSMDREIICLRYINEVPAADIGKIMNLSRFAVRRRLNRSLKLLSGYIKKEDFKP